MTALWERQPSDTEESWPAFVAYRDQRPPRRLEPLRCTPPNGVTPSFTKLMAWYASDAWQTRVTAYDQHVDAILREEREAILKQHIRDVTIEHLATLKTGRELAHDQLEKFLLTARSSQAHGLLKPNEIVKLLEICVKLERLCRGESTEKIDAEIDLSGLTPEELRVLQDLHKRQGGT